MISRVREISVSRCWESQLSKPVFYTRCALYHCDRRGRMGFFFRGGEMSGTGTWDEKEKMKAILCTHRPFHPCKYGKSPSEELRKRGAP